MIRLFFSLTTISIVIVSIWCSDGYTVHNSLLTGHVFKTVESIDWLQCVEECHIHDECISYNYFPPEKVCELNNFDFDNQCDAGNNLIRATGWIHHVFDKPMQTWVTIDFGFETVYTSAHSWSSFSS